MTLALHRATPADAPQIGAILSGWVDETPWLARAHDDYPALAGWLIDIMPVTVARRQNHLAGFLAQRDDQIHALYLGPADRGQGLGHQMIARAKTTANCLTVWCYQANLAAQRFYMRHGFVETCRTNGQGNDEHLPDMQMIWTRGHA